MKKAISFTLTVLLASAVALIAASPDKDAFEAREKTAWQTFKERKADDFKKLVSPDLVCVYADGTSNLQKELDGMSKWDIKSFELSDYQVTMTDADTAICTYKANISATFAGNDMSGTHNCGSIWQMKNGEWRAIFHTDIKAAASPSP